MIREPNNATKWLVTKLMVVVVAMFGFGYLMVPLYNVFCELTGFNGRAGRMTVESAAALQRDDSRQVKVEFVTNVNSGFPWNFKPMVASVTVHPGEETLVMFEAVNRSDSAVTGQAVPSVSPVQVTRFFSKTECFCFTQQTLAAKETKQMPVRFIVNPNLPRDIDTITLGYTFFRSDAQAAVPAFARPSS